MCIPPTQDSDDSSPPTPNPANGAGDDGLAAKMAAQKLQDEREGELMKLQAKQRMAVQRQVSRSSFARPAGAAGGLDDLRGLDFSAGFVIFSLFHLCPFFFLLKLTTIHFCFPYSKQYLPPPIEPNAHTNYPTSRVHDSGSELSDYDSSDDDFQLHARSRRPSRGTGDNEPFVPYGQLGDGQVGNLLDENEGEEDPFADPFFNQVQEDDHRDSRARKEWFVPFLLLWCSF